MQTETGKKKVEKDYSDLQQVLIKLKNELQGQSLISQACSKIKCENGHVLKKKAKAGENNVYCDVCLTDKINQTGILYFKCEQGCNYDICPSCYYLKLVDDKEALQQVEMKANRERELIRLLSGFNSVTIRRF